MVGFFDTPIKKVKVRNGVYAYKFSNGWITVGSQKYLYYSMTEAIKKWRDNN